MVRLLAEKYDGICCGENFHMELLDLAEPAFQPNLCYFDTMSSWEEFVSRTPEEYDAWIQGTSREAAQLEVIRLIQLVPSGKKIFVDTNIPPALLREISEYCRVAIMLSPQSMSVNRFFDREDAEKQFLYQVMLNMPNPDAALQNFRNCLSLVNGEAHHREFLESGFFTLMRNE